MCGIVGVWSSGGVGNRGSAEHNLAVMAGAVAHRGPDGQGVWVDETIGLGHARLAVIDLTDAAAQPMADASSELHIVYNGEIYNHRELRAELIGLGHRFKSQSDTEVLIEGYKRWGLNVLQRLNGMFAFALWDSRTAKLVLARDRVGKKPLYYARLGDTLLFASEIKGILNWPGMKRSANLAAIHQYLTYQYVPAPMTAFEGIHKLPPASVMVLEADGSQHMETYWSLARPEKSLARPVGEIEAELRDRFDAAVKRRLISDVPLGAFLSGGIDSASVVASMAHVSSDPIKTFTIGFEEPAFDERRYAKLVSDRYGTEHHEFVVSPDAISVLPKLVWHYGEPFADSSAIPTYYLSELTRRHVTVALNGDGGDENFLGYPRYVGAWLGSWMNRLPGSVRRALGAAGSAMPGETSHIRILRYLRRFLMEANEDDVRRYGKWITFFSAAQKSELYGDAMRDQLGDDPLSGLDGWFEGDAPIASRAAFADIHSYLPDDLLVKVDVASMAHGLEARSPFLDHEFMEFAATIPADVKMRRWQTKAILKSAMADRLPQELLHRPKMGFGVPIERWLRGELRDMAYDVLVNGLEKSLPNVPQIRFGDICLT
ncbi:MAG: asparagine synthase (glutamine-hydrolyzing), partial [Rhodospirillales bacterium]|nr:asparagine synthase (glutamine-hydrolyzing) [Rhodospirillales bacterium]